MRRILLAILALFTLSLSATAQGTVPAASPDQSAAPANRTGFFIGFDPMVYASLTSDVITAGKTNGGTGVSLRFGWGFNERLALVMDVPVTDLVVSDSADFLLSHGDIALMYFPTALTLWGRPLVPFVQVGGGFRDIESTLYAGGAPQIYAFASEVFSVGIGARYYVERRWAISLQGWWSSGEFNDERIGNTTTHNRHVMATSSRIQAGLEWHRGRKPR